MSSRARNRLLAVLLSSVALAGTGQVFAATVAITGAKAFSMTSAEPLENATIVVTDGRIQAVGAGLAPPPGARIIEAKGRVVTPGLMNADSQLGLIEVDSTDDTVDQAVKSGPLGASFDVQYALNPNSNLIRVARADGLTRAVSVPTGSASAPFAGQGAIVRLVEGGDMLDRAKAAMFVVIGGPEDIQAGGSRSAQWLVLRNALNEARRYQAQGAGAKLAPRDQVLNHLDAEALQPVLAGKMPLVISAERESDIRQAVKLADDYHLRVIVFGGAEAWRVADLLAARKIPVVVDPFANMPVNFDEIGARSDNAAILQRHGVIVAIALVDFLSSIHRSHDAGSALREAAGLAVSNGLPWVEALKAITINPARIWGVADHYGALAPGQDADLVLWDGDPLDVSGKPAMVMVQGREVSLVTRQTELRDRYRPQRAADPTPPAFR